MVFIENEHIKVSISTKGAELQSIKGTDSLTEFLWNADTRYWAKHSPILFPIVGALKENTFFFEGKSYTLPRHGFARDMEFDVVKVSENEVLLTLSHNAETLSIYPFEFNLGVRYKLNLATITCSYEVFNPSNQPLLFAVGGHPAFAAPLNNIGNYSDYYLKFDKDKELTYHHIMDNLISDDTTTIPLNDGKLFLKHELFYNDALVFKNLKSESITLCNTKTYNGLELSFKDFPYFGIWAAKDANFVCLEPWCGIADSINHNQQLVDKEGINKLAPQEKWERSWKVTCF